MSIENKTSLKVPYQLPEFIRSDENYQTFVAFLQAYYEWMEQKNIGSGKEGATYGSQSLYNYTDIDYVESGDSYNKFIDYYFNDFLPNFPKDALADKTKLIKIARELYQTKGTPASYQFLFRALYNSDAEIFLTRDVVLRASDGKWYVSKSLKLATNDEQFLSIDNYRLFGETSQSFATVERAIRSGSRIEVYISNIERLFVSGEFVHVVDNRNQSLYFKDGQVVDSTTPGAELLRAKVIGSISSVQINPDKRGQLYKGRDTANGYSGDPVIFYGGLNDDTSIGAEAYVLETTTGSIRAVNVIDGSYGYREDPNTYIRFIGGGGKGAIANVSTVNPAGQIDVTYIPQDYVTAAAQLIAINGTYTFFPANTSAKLNCSLANAFTFTGFSTYPIGSIFVNNGGGGYTGVPAIIPDTLYDTTDPQTTESLKLKGKLASLGILGPIQIVNGGTGYANGDIITFTDGAGGAGANANVTVNATGTIISATYRYSNTTNKVTTYPLGGLGYRMDRLPTLNVSTSGGSNAVLRVNQVLGAGAQLEAVPDERGIGAITSFVIENFGEDYISAPFVSLKVRDIVVSNVTPATVPRKGELIYQGGDINTAVFKANVDSVQTLLTNVDPLLTKYLVRTYNYTSNTKTQTLKIENRSNGLPNVYMNLDTTYTTFDASGNYLFNQGVRTYGNGAAQATAKFLNGLIIGNGQYLKDDGFPSSFQVLQSTDYNNFTYDLTVEKSFEAYKTSLYKLLHPAGTKVIPINALRNEVTVNVSSITYESNSLPLAYYTGTTGSNASIFTSFTNVSNNIIKFDAIVGADVSVMVANGGYVSLNSQYGPNVYSKVVNNHLVPYRANLLKRSQKLGTAPWARGAVANVTISADSTTAPDGTLTADKIVESAVTPNFPYFSVRQTATAYTPEYESLVKNPFCFSVYAKAGENNKLNLYIEPNGPVNPVSPSANSVSCTFDVSNGTIYTAVSNTGIATSNVSASIISAGSGWYRCSISSYLVYDIYSARAYITLANNTGSLTYAGNTANGLYCWGAQFEPSYTPTKYIETEAQEVEVPTDVISIEDYAISHFPNVAYANVVSSNTQINITSITNQYDLINNGEYSNTQNKLEDIVFIGDDIRVYANATNDYTGTVTYVSYSNNTIFVTPAPSFTANNANVWVGRNIVSTDVNFFNSTGVGGTPQLITQDGEIIITQDDKVLTLGI